jgi:hypothetical protein
MLTGDVSFALVKVAVVEPRSRATPGATDVKGVGLLVEGVEGELEVAVGVAGAEELAGELEVAVGFGVVAVCAKSGKGRTNCIQSRIGTITLKSLDRI